MQFDLQKAAEQIKNNEDFLKLRTVMEDQVGHNGESTYEHCIQTYDVATKLISGDLIKDSVAKEEFERFIGEEIDGIKKRDLMLITALVHDSGKMVIFDDNKPLFTQLDNGEKNAPEHGFWGSLILKEILLGAGLTEGASEYVRNCVRLHLAGAGFWSIETDHKKLLWELKLSCENYHTEVIFNIYCDLFYNKKFQDKIELPLKLLNDPEAYKPLSFSIKS